MNFNFEKLVKRETPLCGFAKVGLKGGENILEGLKGLHAHLFIKRVGLKGGQNSSEHCESWCAC